MNASLQNAKSRFENFYSQEDTKHLERNRKKREFLDRFERACKFFDDENRITQQKISYVILAYIVGFAILAMIFMNFMSSFESDIIFCDTNLTRLGCEPCPRRAYCKDGKINRCEQGFQIQKHLCVENKPLQLLYSDMINYTASYLAKKRGQAKCDPLVKIDAKLDEIVKVLANQFRSNESYKDAIGMFTTKFRSDNKFKEAGILIKDDHIHQDLLWKVNEEYVEIPFGCAVKLFVANHSNTMAVVLIVSFLGLLWIYKAKRGI